MELGRGHPLASQIVRVTATRPMPVPSDNAPPPDRGGTNLPSGERFPRTARLLRRGEFLRVQQGGKRVHTAHFIILMTRAVGQRLGVTVGRRVGGSVQRNRIKRLVREVFRRNRELFPIDCAVVLVARAGADSLDYASVKAELLRAQAALSRAQHHLPAISLNPRSAP
jgi:ribonuclease P protein component